MHTKLATCQYRRGRICFDSQRSSLGSQDHHRLRACEGQDNHSTLASEYAGALRPVEKMSRVFDVRSIRQSFPNNSRDLQAEGLRDSSENSTNSPDFSCDHDDLPDDFHIVAVTELFWTMELLGVGMDNQVAVLKAAASAQICAVTLE